MTRLRAAAAPLAGEIPRSVALSMKLVRRMHP